MGFDWFGEDVSIGQFGEDREHIVKCVFVGVGLVHDDDCAHKADKGSGEKSEMRIRHSNVLN